MFDDDEITYEEECEILNTHAKNCTAAKEDRYCKICMEY